jgi:hypothetical protein
LPRRRARSRTSGQSVPAPKQLPVAPAMIALPPQNVGGPRWARVAAIVVVTGLLAFHYGLAAFSLSVENPTVDEVVHMPAGLTYWQKGTFRLYRHNPPLVKLVAALPVLWSNPITEPLYQSEAWRAREPSQANIASLFAYKNASRYFELFERARLAMPLFSSIGGLAVFLWSRRMHGTPGGLLSLSLWVFCPNILAHARLITSDLAAAALGVLATYLFWRFLRDSTWRWVIAAGFALGLAQLTKFSMLLFYAIWPLLWLARVVLATPRAELRGKISRGALQGLAIVALSVLTIDAGYFFEGLGVPLGEFEFGSRSLTRRVPQGAARPISNNPLFTATWQFRVNRFRDTWLGHIPCPLPRHYVLGFDEQKIETEGIPERYFIATNTRDEAALFRAVEKERSVPESMADLQGYPVYLNGDRQRTGWWYYYLLALAYKMPEGTLLLLAITLGSLRYVSRSRAEWADEIALWMVPVVIVLAMSFLTDINLGLRYVLPVLPFGFIAAGRLVPWMFELSGPRRRVMTMLVSGSLAATMAATLEIHPDYLAYFNWASGGVDRRPARLIDSNLDWGQDLVGLQKWWKERIPGQRLGLAYFGQINPSIFHLRGEPFDWFLPPVQPRTTKPMLSHTELLIGPAPKLTPGYYAISATLLYGLPWRLYDPAPIEVVPAGFGPAVLPIAWGPAWNAHEFDAFWYFRQFEPIDNIGHSIYIYDLSEEDVARAAPLFTESWNKGGASRP